MLHAADFRVNKSGVKAAAATSIEISNRAGNFGTIMKTIDRPFIFILTASEVDNIKMALPLFMGAVTDIKPVPEV